MGSFLDQFGEAIAGRKETQPARHEDPNQVAQKGDENIREGLNTFKGDRAGER
jgi:hypothetical protein